MFKGLDTQIQKHTTQKTKPAANLNSTDMFNNQLITDVFSQNTTIHGKH